MDKILRNFNKFIKLINSENYNAIKIKISNACGKAVPDNVPKQLFQNRTSKKSRALIQWRDVYNNNLNIDQLNSFNGGIVIEFVNDDFFDDKYDNIETFNILKSKLGSDENVSSMISIRTIDGSSSSETSLKAFEKLKNVNISYNGETIRINNDNIEDYAIRYKDNPSGSKYIGNDNWTGFLYVSIKGGNQESINSHEKNIPLFNPASEMANENICNHINYVLAYFLLKSIRKSDINKKVYKEAYSKLVTELSNTLNEIYYQKDPYNNEKISLLNYCDNHLSLKLSKNRSLYDVITCQPIKFNDFALSNIFKIDLSHNEAVEKKIFYYDAFQNTLLSASRPTNLYWSYHISNMMQQNFKLDDFIKNESDFVKRRNRALKRLERENNEQN